ncbi:uncharacterized protein LOC141590131 [Silene latifolia]|uniref:uncharacterized protein LOC141590131 n=1 Tax=Silene latifolia TaxID=37657 RepID=UPI003D76A758
MGLDKDKNVVELRPKADTRDRRPAPNDLMDQQLKALDVMAAQAKVADQPPPSTGPTERRIEKRPAQTGGKDATVVSSSPKPSPAQIRSEGISHHKGGRIWLIWQPHQYVVDVRCITDQLIHSKVFDKLRNISYYFTMVYGLNKDKERESLWDSLIHISRGIDTAWMVGGDFNSLLHLNKRIGGAEVTWSDITPMRQMVDQCELMELKSTGSFFIWNNKQEVGTKVYSKLDRVLVNGEWLDDFPECLSHFLPEGLFDHCPCLIKFQTRGTPMFRVVQKLKMLKKELKKLDKENFSDIENLTQVSEVSLKEVQKRLIKDPLNKVLCESESALAKEVLILKRARLRFLLEKSKERWMEEGDEN